MLEPLGGRVRVERGWPVGLGGSRELGADVYFPPVEAPARPAVLLIHGGGWQEGDRSQLAGYALQLARRGIVAVACEYRLSPEALWPAQLEDVELAYRRVVSSAQELGIDPGRVALFGNSAGAHLALMLAAELMAAGPVPPAVVALYPPVRLGPASPTGAVAALMGGRLEAEALRRASPIERVAEGFPPTLLLHGNADDVVPCDTTIELYQKLRRLGCEAELHVFDAMPHAFDLEPGFGRQCLQLALLFLERKVVRPHGG